MAQTIAKVIGLIILSFFYGVSWMWLLAQTEPRYVVSYWFFPIVTLLFLVLSLIPGGIGALIGKQVQKQSAGFWLGAYLGPLGWIIVLLLPRNGHPKNTNNARPKPRRPANASLDNDLYRVWLVDAYDIQKNDVLGQYLCAGRPFDTADSALEYAHLSDKATPYQPEVNLSKFSTSFMDTYDFEPVLKGVLFFMGVLLAFSIVMLIFSIIDVDPLSLISN